MSNGSQQVMSEMYQLGIPISERLHAAWEKKEQFAREHRSISWESNWELRKAAIRIQNLAEGGDIALARAESASLERRQAERKRGMDLKARLLKSEEEARIQAALLTRQAIADFIGSLGREMDGILEDHFLAGALVAPPEDLRRLHSLSERARSIIYRNSLLGLPEETLVPRHQSVFDFIRQGARKIVARFCGVVLESRVPSGVH